MWAPRDSPASGATRFGHDLTKRRTMETTGWRTRRYRNSRLSPKVRLGWLRPPALRLALRYICMKSIICVNSTRCPREGNPCLRVKLRGPAAKVSWVIFCSGRLLGSLETQNGHKQLEMERTATSSLVPFRSFQPGRNKLRHAL